MGHSSWRRTSAWSGILFVIVFLVSELTLADSPALSVPAAETRAWFAANTSEIAWVTLGVALSTGLLLLLFASGLRSHLADADRLDGGVWSRLSFASAVAAAAVAASKASVWPVLSHPELDSVLTDEVAKVLGSLEVVALLTVIPWLLAGFLLGASIVIVRRGGLPRWLGWFGLAVSGVFVVGSTWIVGGVEMGVLGVLAGMGYLGFVVWVGAVSVALLRISADQVLTESTVPPSETRAGVSSW